MASISRDAGGRRRIQFVALDGKRKTIRLGKVSQRAAETVKMRVEQLLSATFTSHGIEADTARWLSSIDPKLYDKLARAGLVRERETTSATLLGPWLRSHIDGRADLKPATKVVRNLVINDLAKHFGEERDVRTITPGDADDFKQWLVGRKLAPTTIHKRLQVARSFFNAMRRRKLVSENPFEGVNVAAAAVRDRQRFITRPETKLVLDTSPSHHWRAIIALARFGGLRCPSEVLSLRWQDIDWERQRIVVSSPKTEHHVGRSRRTIPMFPELRSYLEESFEAADDGAVYVIDERMRQAAQGPNGWQNVNLRTTFQKIVRRAGLDPWPRLFQNLRASRETELVERFPVQVVTDWLGNTPSVAMQHYLMTTEEHFEAALEGHAGEENLARKTAQQAHAGSRKASHAENATQNKTPVLPGLAMECGAMPAQKVAEEGLEPPTRGL